MLFDLLFYLLVLLVTLLGSDRRGANSSLLYKQKQGAKRGKKNPTVDVPNSLDSSH